MLLEQGHLLRLIQYIALLLCIYYIVKSESHQRKAQKLEYVNTSLFHDLKYLGLMKIKALILIHSLR